MVNQIEGGFMVYDDSCTLSNAHELAAWITEEYVAEDRMNLAAKASEAALNDIPKAYQNPFVRQAAQSAARMALGLKELPAQEGEA